MPTLLMSLFLSLAASTPVLTPASHPLLEVVSNILPMFILLGLVALGIKVLKRPSVKGMIGEAVVNWAGLSRLEKSRYRVLKNVFIPSIASDGMTELDHVVVSTHGIFVIETKNYGGWIYGNEHDRMWTRTNYRKKCKFLNPLKQNKGHVDSLAAFLGLPQSAFHSVVFFIGDATIKTPMPPNVLSSGLIGYIEAKRDILLSESQMNSAWTCLSNHDDDMDKRTVRRKHVARLSARAQS
jgi:restriction system protein